jgi:hypothetical protein
MPNVRIFTQYRDEELSIAGEVFAFKALPSGKAAKIADLVGDSANITKVLEDLSSNLSSDMSTSEELKNIGNKIFDSRYRIIAFALQINEDSDEYKRLKAAIDNASFPEIFWVIDQIMEINGLKRLEKMVKNLLKALENLAPEIKDYTSRLLKKFTEDEEILQTMTDRMKSIRATGSTSSSSDSPESPTTLPTPISSASSR